METLQTGITPDQLSAQEQPKAVPRTRRGFFKKVGSTALILGAATPMTVAGSVFTESEQKTETFHQPVAKHLANNEVKLPVIINDSQSPLAYLETALVQRSLITPAMDQIENTATELGIPHGNAAHDQETMKKLVQEKPIPTFMRACLSAPFLEEAACRLIPSTLAGSKGMQWGAGLLWNIYFSALHSIKTEGYKPWTTTLRPKIHTSANVIGLYTWGLVRQRGFGHAVLAHAIHNTYAFGEYQKEERNQKPNA